MGTCYRNPRAHGYSPASFASGWAWTTPHVCVANLARNSTGSDGEGARSVVEPVRVAVYDALGREGARLADGSGGLSPAWTSRHAPPEGIGQTGPEERTRVAE